MKVSRRGQSEPLTLVQITAENIDEFRAVLSNPWIGAWVVSDRKGYVKNFGSKQSIEAIYEPAPIRFQHKPGWIDRAPEKVKR